PQLTESNLEKPIYFAFSYDEEIGCLAAPELIRHINNHYSEKPKFALIGEPSMMQPIIGQKGICVLETKVNGSAGHSSRIKQEVSAIHEASRLILWLENKMNSLVDQGHIDDRFSPPHTSIHIGKFNGGIAPNVICDKASFMWDVRVIPKDNVSDILMEFKTFCDERSAKLRETFPGFEIITTEVHPPVPPLDTDENKDIVKLVQSISGINSWDTVSFAAEAGQFAEGGFESIICGPGSIAQAHRANEFISKEQLKEGVKMLERLIQEFSVK
ncbi:MAG: M20/M25/M40 family metallo-hydrolase, partial [Nitrosopumilus sp.]|nr:M20/M25/M40 family metallo-hydrolase [Nitrosopumilus sp.]